MGFRFGTGRYGLHRYSFYLEGWVDVICDEDGWTGVDPAPGDPWEGVVTEAAAWETAEASSPSWSPSAPPAGTWVETDSG